MRKITVFISVLFLLGMIGCEKRSDMVKELIINGDIVTDTIVMSGSVIVNEVDTFMIFVPKVGDIIKDNGIEYTVLDDTTLKVTKVEFSAVDVEGVLSIPEVTSKGVAVTRNRTVIFERGLPVTIMGKEVMKARLDVKEVRMPSVKIVDDLAFYKCNELITVSMPKAETVGVDCFSNCNALVNISMPVVKRVDSWGFFGCDGLLEVDMPMVEMIGVEAFWNCDALVEVNMPKVKILEVNSFWDCYSLVLVNMPNVEMVREKAFLNCIDLTTVKMPKTECCFLPDSFKGCSWQPGENETTSSCE